MNKSKFKAGTMLGLLLLFFGWGFLESSDLKTLVKDVFPIPSTTGNEELLAGRVRAILPKGSAVEDDGLGGFAVRLGQGEPKLVVIAALDGYGFFVSGITPEGYLRVDRAVPPPHAQFDGYLLGQPVVISTRYGPVSGVVAQPAMHLLTQEVRKTVVENFSLENAFVDIGVRSEAEARGKGIEILDALTFWPQLTELAGDRWAGPSLGVKAVCAALISASTRWCTARSSAARSTRSRRSRSFTFGRAASPTRLPPLGVTSVACTARTTRSPSNPSRRRRRLVAAKKMAARTCVACRCVMRKRGFPARR